ncbi:MAG TPA: orotate phosphoribosyltransferase [Tenuifilaceae bacterium]|jgi:orotate phosphoribosyltransferase|nr:orotate phosphoribosyltransferase [Bacteroidales bacterium]HNT41791.1 orotate phosphoribosyltransferase [Tenuifilaceae bacterium]NLI87985.1 orotate phosphoribosyltransferase [Bacteroidales bacterium]HOC35553.1 orotate phosphoribosyltransferase [Tenuifilaceae bacterium]HOG71584.1 orotate phosphoribosyltransferase [Tenuifilaceae bacterium]
MTYSEAINAESIAANLLKIKAIRLSPTAPFTWASGLKSPIYCDNRITLSYPDVRNRICNAFVELVRRLYPDVELVAGVATGAIAHGMLVADRLNLPFVYVRSSPKSHGLANRIEGEYRREQKVVVIEDLISTGQSSIAAVEALKEAGCNVLGLLAIFSYQLEQADENFTSAGVELTTLTNYSELIGVAVSTGVVNASQLQLLMSWHENPESWGNITL